MYCIRPIHLSTIVYLMCSLHILPAESQKPNLIKHFDVFGKRTSPLPTPAQLSSSPSSSSSSLSSLNVAGSTSSAAAATSSSSSSSPSPLPLDIVEYFQSLFSQVIPLNIDRSKTKVFLVKSESESESGSQKQTESAKNDSISSWSRNNIEKILEQYRQPPTANSNLVYSSTPFERRSSLAYAVLANDSIPYFDSGIQGRSANILANNSVLVTSSSGLINDHHRRMIQPQLSPLQNNSNQPIPNPFEANPYHSSDDFINSLIQHVFSDLSLQSLPPEELLFGKLPTTSNGESHQITPTQINSDAIFANYTLDLVAPVEPQSPPQSFPFPPPTEIIPPSPSQVQPPYSSLITNTNNYQPPLNPVNLIPRIATTPTQSVASSPQLPTIIQDPIPIKFGSIRARYEAGVVYSDNDEQPQLAEQPKQQQPPPPPVVSSPLPEELPSLDNLNDQSVYVDLNRIQSGQNQEPKLGNLVLAPSPPASQPPADSQSTPSLILNYANLINPTESPVSATPPTTTTTTETSNINDLIDQIVPHVQYESQRLNANISLNYNQPSQQPQQQINVYNYTDPTSAIYPFVANSANYSKDFVLFPYGQPPKQPPRYSTNLLTFAFDVNDLNNSTNPVVNRSTISSFYNNILHQNQIQNNQSFANNNYVPYYDSIEVVNLNTTAQNNYSNFSSYSSNLNLDNLIANNFTNLPPPYLTNTSDANFTSYSYINNDSNNLIQNNLTNYSPYDLPYDSFNITPANNYQPRPAPTLKKNLHYFMHNITADSIPTPFEPLKFKPENLLAHQQQEAVLSESPAYNSISRSKPRDLSKSSQLQQSSTISLPQQHLHQPQIPLPQQYQNILDSITPELDEKLNRIVSLPNYKFYLGKKMGK